MISFLTRKRDVCDKEIVTIPLKSVRLCEMSLNLLLTCLSARTTSQISGFAWDFREKRFRPTRHMLKIVWPDMKSWMVESSLDGVNWTEIDRRTDTGDLRFREMASFPVSRFAQCRFIRLTGGTLATMLWSFVLSSSSGTSSNDESKLPNDHFLIFI
jgi:hypothetical protein